MTAKSSEHLLLDWQPFFRECVKRLRGDDPEFDREFIHGLCEVLHISPRRMIAKLRTHCHEAPPSLN
jgi:hypothetical protein